jgi:hypothetical protein
MADSSEIGNEGSYVKGMATSLVFQAIAFLAGVCTLRTGGGWFLMCSWGLTQWVLVLPMARRWNRRAETGAVKGMYAMSSLGAIPSTLAVYLVVLIVVGRLAGR